MRHHRRIIMLALILTPLAIISVGCDYEADAKANMQEGNKIVAALKAFKSKNGHYPTSLQELIPIYLKKLPDLRGDAQGWEYDFLDGQQNFTLGFNGKRHGWACYYDSMSNIWGTDDK